MPLKTTPDNKVLTCGMGFGHCHYLHNVDNAGMARSDPESFLPLTHLMYHLLAALTEEPSHAYALVQAIRTRSDGRIDPGTGSFYSMIRQAADEGLVCETAGATGPDGRRRVYDITPLGRSVLQAEVRRLEQQLAATRRTLAAAERRGR
jgi:DNA-binding PadR family transcriptional regulator